MPQDRWHLPPNNRAAHHSACSSVRHWRRNISTGMDQILPGLFVGGLRDAIDVNQLEENKIRAIVSAHGFTKECDFGGAKVENVLRIVLNDSPSENVLKHFSSINTFIHSHRLKQENVLVHCLAGASRSVCFCVSYLMTVTNLDYTNALDYISARRYCARPNFGFKMQLMKFGQKHLSAEQQRLFGEFVSQQWEEQFIQLYRQDCQFTNSLFAVKTNEMEMHFCCSSLLTSSLLSSISTSTHQMRIGINDAQGEAEIKPAPEKEEEENKNQKHSTTTTAINNEEGQTKNGADGGAGTTSTSPVVTAPTTTTTTAKLLENLYFIDE